MIKFANPKYPAFSRRVRAQRSSLKIKDLYFKAFGGLASGLAQAVSFASKCQIPLLEPWVARVEYRPA